MSTMQPVYKTRQGFSMSLETALDVAAMVYLYCNALTACLFGGLVVYFADQWLVGLSAAFVIMASGSVVFLFLRYCAEQLRVSKHQAGLPYEGRITGPKEESVLSCSNCGQVLHSEYRCDECGAIAAA